MEQSSTSTYSKREPAAKTAGATRVDSGFRRLYCLASKTQWSNLLPVHIRRENRRQRPPALQESIAPSADSTAWLPRPNGAIFYQYIFEERTGGKDRRRYKSR